MPSASFFWLRVFCVGIVSGKMGWKKNFPGSYLLLKFKVRLVGIHGPFATQALPWLQPVETPVNSAQFLSLCSPGLLHGQLLSGLVRGCLIFASYVPRGVDVVLATGDSQSGVTLLQLSLKCTSLHS